MTTLERQFYKRKNETEFNVKKFCIICKRNGTRKRYNFAVTRTRKVKICVECKNKFKDKGLDLEKWLKENVIFSHPNKYGKIVGTKGDPKC
ncbi:MAG: hypothetical protein PHD05_02455 [Sphaerochaetaceae bacterium]|nr:hypothetical protein [Sphaerochaetaceae bacterium]